MRGHYTCRWCDFTCEDSNDLVAHLRDVHSLCKGCINACDGLNQCTAYDYDPARGPQIVYWCPKYRSEETA